MALRADLERALLDVHPAAHPSEALHERVERECWKQHYQDFGVCDQPACVLLRRIAALLGWEIGMNGVSRPVQTAK